MISKLCYLFTFVTSILNILGVTNLAWNIVFAPSVIIFAMNVMLLAVCFMTVVLTDKIDKK